MKPRAASTPSRDIAAEVMTLINAQLDAGVVPWHRPWTQGGLPRNLTNDRPYRGINVFLLEMAQAACGYTHPLWATYHQMKLASGYVYDKDAKVKYQWRFKPGDDARVMSRDENGKPVFGDVFRIARCEMENEFNDDMTLFDEEGVRHPQGTYADPGYGVKHGEKGTLVIFWKRIEYEKRDAGGAVVFDAAGNPVQAGVMLLRHYIVFNVDQCELPEGVVASGVEATRVIDPSVQADHIVDEYTRPASGGPQVAFGGDRAYYRPSTDEIQMPQQAAFDDDPSYYATLFHECVHSTGHPKRLDRFGEQDDIGTQTYSREELTAEMGAAMLLSMCDILHAPLVENSAAYIASWRKQCVEDPRLIINAAAKAQRAVDLIIGQTWEDQE